jgi:hypothetical protein
VIEFSRYPHVGDLIAHYAKTLCRDDIGTIMASSITTSHQAKVFSRFIWDMVGQMNEDEENGIEVIGSTDNTEMIPDISYEITKLMRNAGFYEVWKKVSDEET